MSTASQQELVWTSHLPVTMTQKDATQNLSRTEPCQLRGTVQKCIAACRCQGLLWEREGEGAPCLREEEG